jgi:hypothetical protein
MRPVLSAFAALAAITLCATQTYAQAQPRSSTPAELWNGLDQLARIMFLRGFVDGAVMSRALVLNFVRAGDVRAAYLRSVSDRAVPFDSALGLVADEIAGVPPQRLEPMARLITQLYADSANSCIRIASMALAALRRLNGLGDREFGDYLARLRSLAPETC